MIIKFHLWYENCQESEFEKEVDYIPDMILYNGTWWEKETSSIDFDTDRYTKIHYKEIPNNTKPA